MSQNEISKKYLFNYKPIPKSATGISGFDEITNGGLPEGRISLIVGSAGSGKTVFGMQFLVMGAVKYGEPGVMMSFEESEAELVKNFSSIGYDIQGLLNDNRLFIDHIHIERKEILESGEFDLEGIFLRLQNAITKVGAKRVVMDSLEALFSGIENQSILRAEIRRLFRWLRDKGLTVISTGEKGTDTFTRYGFEEYLADCVIFLDQQIINKITTRRLRILKYRGSEHGGNEYPFIITKDGFSVFPITSLTLEHEAPSEKISTGNDKLDKMIAGGFYKGASTLISGTAGTGKTTLANLIAAAAAHRGDRSLYISLEESPKQIIRNMGSVGLGLDKLCKAGRLKMISLRPSFQGLESHLVAFHKEVEEYKPDVFVLDPISSFMQAGTGKEAKSMVTRVIDYLKEKKITAFFTFLMNPDLPEQTEIGISSLMDNWIMLKDAEQAGERHHLFYILKARGSNHSKQVREYEFTKEGIDFVDAYMGPEGILTGTARELQKEEDKNHNILIEKEIELKKSEIERKSQLIEQKIKELKESLKAQKKLLELEVTKLQAANRDNDIKMRLAKKRTKT